MNEQQRGSSAFERSSDCTGISKNQHVESERRPSWRGRGSESPALRRQSSSRTRSFVRAPEHKQWWKFTLRPWDDDQEQDWWFAGTAIPLLAATIGMCKRVDSGQCTASLVLAASYHGVEGGPLANVLSIAALVTPWRMCLLDGVDAASCPWDGLIGIEVSMNQYVPPQGPQQSYTQGFWYAVIAAVLYLICSMLLMVNMLGYFLGHYPQRFNLTNSQRTLILQTMLFFVWLAGGAGVFSLVESKYGEDLFNWSYVNALYFCQVTVLTIGFGDLYASSNIGRGLIMPYAVGGIIMLGLIVTSLTTFAAELGEDNIVQKHIERSRTRTIGRSYTSSIELRDREQLGLGLHPTISRPFDPVNRSIAFAEHTSQSKDDEPSQGAFSVLKRTATIPLTALRPARKPRLLLLREEKDRFNAMRKIQSATLKWKKWSGLCVSVAAFAILWCIGALIFWIAERRVQGITYFQSLYLCWVSLLTVGYGDLAPKSNAGRPFFVVWSLIAVPTMTLLVADMSTTIVNSFNQGAFRLADFTILPKAGIWRTLIPQLAPWIQAHKERKAARHRLQRGFETGGAEEEPTIDNLAKEQGSKAPSDGELARRLAHAIQRTAKDLQDNPPRRYTYEEWVQFTQLIRFTAAGEREEGGNRYEADQDGLIEWDWIGEHSPLMAQQSEAAFVLDRLCESMARYVRKMEGIYGGDRGNKDRDDDIVRMQSLDIQELDEQIAEA
ncbi:voltage-gated potassium channel [Aureobasidium pullulans]|uniref:Voltage-gated potassium channel n=1 Tax=Aureobasidium pullulans TaxID=5580 RepID=A0A4V4K9H1_AURPU|nr:voltage-gated potassium channel [Aureobasidium pullulans]THY79920.1 voltage-gated potassium channel [Aureobasidium pullulans]THZ45570.1 voltage-gated potassium channel [Aureobasidium pullulans]TIA47652.1 voltage-gated potassium channel [Aureobasidium pullulans]